MTKELLEGAYSVENVLMENTPPSPEGIMQLGMGFWASKTLLSAVELEVFTLLAQGALGLDELRAKLGLHERSAADFLDALVALGMLNREGGMYSNTQNTEIFLDKAKPSYVGGILEMANHRLYPFWANLTEGLKTGEPQNEAKVGEDFFGKLYSNPARLKEFLIAMSGVSRGANMAMGAKVPWSEYKSFVDIGTAQGDLPAQIALQNKHLKGIGFDLPPVEPVFEEYMQELGLSDRVTFQAGDFFVDDFPKADVVLMGHILHDWDLDQKRMLVAKAYNALPDGGMLVVYDALIDDERRKNVFGLLLSLCMLIETPGGFDYTESDGIGWLTEAGFKDVRVEHLLGPDSMLIGIK